MLVESSLFSRDLSQKRLQIEKRAGLVTDLRAKSAAKGLILEIDLFRQLFRHEAKSNSFEKSTLSDVSMTNLALVRGTFQSTFRCA